MKNNDFFILLFAIWVVALATMIAVVRGEDDAMKVCQLSHSYDTCFKAVNG